MDLGTVLITYAADTQDFIDETQKVLDAMDQVSQASSAMAQGSSGGGFFDALTKGASDLTSSMGGVGKVLGDSANGFLEFAKSGGEAALFIKEFGTTAIDMAKAVFADNAAMEGLATQFTRLLGSGEEATKMMDTLDKTFSGTSLDIKTIDTAATKLLSMKVAAGDVVPILKNVGDAVTGLGKGSEAFNTIISKLALMSETGKVTSASMTALSKQGIDAWGMLAQYIQKSVPETMAEVKAGYISADLAVNALSTGMKLAFGGDMATQAKTFSGLIAVIGNNMEKAWLAFSGPAFKVAETALGTISKALADPAFGEFATELGTLIGKAASSLADILGSTLGPAIMDLLGAIGSDVKAFADWISENEGVSASFSVLGQVIKAILTIVAGFIEVVAKLVGVFSDVGIKGDIARAALVALGIALAAIKITALIEAIPALVAGFIAWATGAGLAAAATAILTTVILPLLALAAVVVVITAIILVVQHWADIAPVLVDAWKKASDTMKGIGDSLADNWNKNLTKQAKDEEDFGKGLDNNLVKPVKALGKTIEDAFNSWGTGIQKAVETLGKNFGDWWQKEFGKGLSNVMTILGLSLKNVLGTWGKQIQADLAPALAAMTSFGQNAVKTFQSWNDTLTANWKKADDVQTKQNNDFLKQLQDNWTKSMDAIVKSVTKMNQDSSKGLEEFDKHIEDGLKAGLDQTNKWADQIQKAAGDALMGMVQSASENMSKFGQWIEDGAKKGLDALTKFGAGVLDAIEKPFKAVAQAIASTLNEAMGFINKFVDAANKALSTLGFGFQLPSLPQFAEGIQGFGGGLAIVGEKGPELVNLGAGSSVYPLSGVPFASTPTLPTMNAGGAGMSSGGTQTIILQVDGRILAQALGASLTKEIRLVTGVRR